MHKRTLSLITIFEVAVFFITLTGMVFVPDSVIPRPLWPLLLGLSYLGVVVLLTVRKGSLPKGRLGELMGGAFFTTLGLLLLFYPGRINLACGISLAVMLVIGLLWAAWNARKESVVTEDQLDDSIPKGRRL